MQLSKAGLADRKQWEEKGYRLPQFDREQMVAATKEAPYWVHLEQGIFPCISGKCGTESLK